MTVAVDVAMIVIGGAIGILVGLLLVALWYRFGIRHIVCRIKGHAYEYDTFKHWDYDRKFCWREARELPKSEWGPKSEADLQREAEIEALFKVLEP